MSTVDDTPTTRALPAMASWLLILLSTALIFAVGMLDRGEETHEELVGAFEIEVGARSLVGLDLVAADQLEAAAETESTGLQSQLAEQAVLRRDEALAELDATATAPASMRRLAALYAWLGREGDEAHRARAIELLDAAVAGRRDDPRRLAPELAELYADADADDALMRSVLSDGATLTDADAAGLVERLGWFGELFVAAQEPGDGPLRSALVERAHWTYRLSGLSSLVLIGVILLSIIAWIRRARSPHPWHVPMSARMRPEAGHPIYLEAFAVYLGVQVALLLLSLLLPTPMWLSASGIVIASLLGVLWPFLRGVSWSSFRESIGLHTGAGLWREIGAGLYGYLLVLPFVLLGLVFAWGLQELWALFGPEAPDASHPAALNVAFGGWFERILMLLLAAGFAPFFEELIFRGALFGYLRARYRFIVSAAIMAVIFAVLHPQGLLAVPALAALAAGFAAIRQARGSLVAPMAAHAAHNGALMVSLMILFL